MKSLPTFLTLSLLLVISTSTQHVRYVNPNNSPFPECPGQPCLTLDQYTQQAETYFTTGATFIFLSGNHTPQTRVSLENISTITLKGNDNDSNITVMCRNTIILCENVENLTIKGLIFQFHSSNIHQEFSALRLYNCTGIEISNSTFQGSGKLHETGKRAVYSQHSTITIISCLFDGNTGDNGGAIYANGSNITHIGNVFTRNKAKSSGGAIYAENSSIHLINEFMYINDAMELYSNMSNYRGNNRYTLESHITLLAGAALYLSNEAYDKGGAIYLSDSNASLSGVFRNNLAKFWGAAIGCMSSRVKITGNSYFINNGHDIWSVAMGGAISVYKGLLTITGNAIFHYNKATSGGAISIMNSDALLDGKIIEFLGNAALNGGGMRSVASNLTIKAEQLNFIGNTAEMQGGAIIINTIYASQQVEISGNFINNTGIGCGGAVYMLELNDITFTDITATGNSGSAFCVVNSKVTFTGYTRITSNTGKFGGGISSRDSILLFTDNIEIGYNKALIGGGIYSLYGEIVFQNVKGESTGIALFTHNTAARDGGAIYATDTDITFNIPVHFVSNSAQNGGAMYFKTAATLTLDIKRGAMLTSHNHASEFGGVLYHEDAASYIQCKFNPAAGNDVTTDELPYCLLQLKNEDPVYIGDSTPITSYMNSAKNGEFMYGGLLDRCRIVRFIGSDNHKSVLSSTAIDYLKHISHYNNITEEMTSAPYQLCFYESNHNQVYDCSGEKSLSIQRGQLMRISLIALDQAKKAASTRITAIASPTATLQPNQNLQDLLQSQFILTYNLYSAEKHEQLILYPDGPCRDTGLARAVVNVMLLPCPDGFTQSTSGEQCMCEERLKVYDAECMINDKIYITGSDFWMSSLNKNGTYQGLVLYKTCPLDYCTNKSVNLTLDSPDVQCDHNRSGVLCGECNANYSLLLGSSKCQVCSNTYLALLFPFTAAGIALVVSLSFLRLTVATGMINSIILYANIVQVNRNLFFTRNENNVFTVFIAWLNLDLGFQTCFHNGMDAFAQTCLQFAFPLYIWILICLIIVTSRYSITVSRLIGHNPIAVLATLLLMSYTKILKIVIEVYSSVDLDYPDNKKVTVWLKDANVPYLQSKHLLLTVVTSLVLVFLFLPYTLLLLLGHKLYRFTNRKGLRWLNKMKPLLDSYYAPYKMHTRYWTGFLLLVRCALYIIFSFNSLGATTKSLLAINITFTVIGLAAGFLAFGKVYNGFYTNITEALVYLNLIILSGATLAGANTTALVYSLVGMVFATMIGITVYHFHLLYTAKTSMWLKIRAKIASLVESVKTLTSNTTTAPPPVDLQANTSSHDPHKIVTKTVIDLREPLLEK